ncbi:MAG: hypothetical protein JNK24_02360 [Alphaproteobacteria bacterium]|nr:hypothetical protein [Alphaproteobacteria bacterium]
MEVPKIRPAGVAALTKLKGDAAHLEITRLINLARSTTDQASRLSPAELLRQLSEPGNAEKLRVLFKDFNENVVPHIEIPKNADRDAEIAQQFRGSFFRGIFEGPDATAFEALLKKPEGNLDVAALANRVADGLNGDPVKKDAIITEIGRLSADTADLQKFKTVEAYKAHLDQLGQYLKANGLIPASVDGRAALTDINAIEQAFKKGDPISPAEWKTFRDHHEGQYDTHMSKVAADESARLQNAMELDDLMRKVDKYETFETPEAFEKRLGDLRAHLIKTDKLKRHIDGHKDSADVNEITARINGGKDPITFAEWKTFRDHHEGQFKKHFQDRAIETPEQRQAAVLETQRTLRQAALAVQVAANTPIPEQGLLRKLTGAFTFGRSVTGGGNHYTPVASTADGLEQAKINRSQIISESLAKLAEVTTSANYQKLELATGSRTSPSETFGHLLEGKRVTDSNYSDFSKSVANGDFAIVQKTRLQKFGSFLKNTLIWAGIPLLAAGGFLGLERESDQHDNNLSVPERILYNAGKTISPLRAHLSDRVKTAIEASDAAIRADAESEERKRQDADRRSQVATGQNAPLADLRGAFATSAVQAGSQQQRGLQSEDVTKALEKIRSNYSAVFNTESVTKITEIYMQHSGGKKIKGETMIGNPMANSEILEFKQAVHELLAKSYGNKTGTAYLIETKFFKELGIQ